VVDGTALAGVDYDRPSNAVITFPANTTTVPIDIRFRGNAIAQADRSFHVQIDSVINGTPGTTVVAPVTIVDDDRILVSGQPAGRIAAVGATATMVFTVRLRRAPTVADGPVSVNFRTGDGQGVSGALAGLDYLAANGTLTFNPGEVSKTISVTVLARRAGQRYPKNLFLTLSGISAGGWLANNAVSQTVLGRIS
jgi:hypothetical protein